MADVEPEEGELSISFDRRSVTYGFGELDTQVPAYAASVHSNMGRHALIFTQELEYRMPVAMRATAVLIPYRPQALSALIRSSNVSNSIQNCPHFGVLMRQLGHAITEGEMAYIRETEEFDQQTLHILGDALDEAWRRVKSNHLNGRAYGARTVLAQHIFAMAKQGERDPHRLIDGALMRLTL